MLAIAVFRPNTGFSNDYFSILFYLVHFCGIAIFFSIILFVQIFISKGKSIEGSVFKYQFRFKKSIRRMRVRSEILQYGLYAYVSSAIHRRGLYANQSD